MTRYVSPLDMLAELRDDNMRLARKCARRTASATSTATSATGACSIWIDEAERRVWFLFEATGAAIRRAAKE